MLRKFADNALFRRLAIGSPTFGEMVAEAVMKDRTGQDYRLAAHNARSIDLVAPDGRHVQVKTVGTRGSFAGIRRGRDAAVEVLVIATFGERPRFFQVPMERFKALARTYDYPERGHFRGRPAVIASPRACWMSLRLQSRRTGSSRLRTSMSGAVRRIARLIARSDARTAFCG